MIVYYNFYQSLNFVIPLFLQLYLSLLAQSTPSLPCSRKKFLRGHLFASLVGASAQSWQTVSFFCAQLAPNQALPRSRKYFLCSDQPCFPCQNQCINGFSKMRLQCNCMQIILFHPDNIFLWWLFSSFDRDRDTHALRPWQHITWCCIYPLLPS